MPRRTLPLLAVLAPTGCSSAEAPRFPSACLVAPQELRDALAAAPQDVRIGGFRISTCVRRAVTSDAALQELGTLLTSVADGLGTDARDGQDAELARQLGFLTGAVRRGTGEDSGVAVELGRRVGRAALKLRADPALIGAANAAVDVGRRAG